MKHREVFILIIVLILIVLILIDEIGVEIVKKMITSSSMKDSDLFNTKMLPLLEKQVVSLSSNQYGYHVICALLSLGINEMNQNQKSTNIP